MYSGPEAAYDHCEAFMPDCDRDLSTSRTESAYERPTEYEDYDSASNLYDSYDYDFDNATANAYVKKINSFIESKV